MCNNERRERYLDVGNPRAGSSAPAAALRVPEVFLLPAVVANILPAHGPTSAQPRIARSVHLWAASASVHPNGWHARLVWPELNGATPCASKSTLPGTRVDGMTAWAVTQSPRAAQRAVSSRPSCDPKSECRQRQKSYFLEPCLQQWRSSGTMRSHPVLGWSMGVTQGICGMVD